jgi:hypothetical protein
MHYFSHVVGTCALFAWLASKSCTGKVATIGSQEHTGNTHKATFTLQAVEYF